MSKKGYRRKKVRLRRPVKRLLVMGVTLCCIMAFLFGTFLVVKSFGKSSLKKHAGEMAGEEVSIQIKEAVAMEQEQTIELQEGQILVEGEVYEYNKDIMTFLCMGIDSRSGITKEKTPGKAGQADALILIVVNPRREKVDVIAVNRDTMTSIEVYDEAGVYLGEEEKQLALQYAYGDGREESCILMEKKVSDLFYGIPIHGYGAMDMQSIATLNDAVGGVEVTILEDMTKFNKNWTKGTQVKLQGKDAEIYIARRDASHTGTNLGRIERQKQYLSEYVKQAKKRMKEDLLLPFSIFQELQQHLVTSLTVQEIAFLADTVLGFEFSTENLINLPGELEMGEKSEEFYLDEDSLREIIVDVFYEKVN